MRLYHGSNTDIDTIDLDQGSQYKDFGKGFYLTPDKETAIRMAIKRSRLFGGVATLIAYEFDEIPRPTILLWFRQSSRFSA